MLYAPPLCVYLCNMLRAIAFVAILILSLGAEAQDTIRLMQYNLLNYRNTTSQCTNSTNNPDQKDGYLETIVSHVNPDIIAVNEMGANWLNPNKILTNALNKNGVNHFAQAEFSNNGFSSITNMLFFNKTKLDLHSQDVIDRNPDNSEMVRVIDVYTLFVKNNALLKGDTTFLTVYLAHLKAGSSSSDKTTRAKMTEAAMNHLKDNHTSHAYFFAGDFNIQSHSEQCYQNLTKNSNTSIRFYDVKNAPGSWNNNSLYANLHTQSTHDGDSRGGCFSTGGMDDRFDFILCGKEVLDNKYGVRYIDGSYKALGQDSRRFNGNIKQPASNIIPAKVSNALYEMSDHLPVLMDVAVTDANSSADVINRPSGIVVSYKGEVVELSGLDNVKQFNLIDNTGRIILSVKPTSNTYEIDGNAFRAGLYHIRGEATNGKYFGETIQLIN